MHTNPTSCQKCRSTSHQSFVHHRRFYYLRKFLPFLQTSMLKCWFLSEQTALSGFRCIETLYIDNIPFIEQLFVFAMHNSVALPCSFFFLRKFVRLCTIDVSTTFVKFCPSCKLQCWNVDSSQNRQLLVGLDASRHCTSTTSIYWTIFCLCLAQFCSFALLDFSGKSFLFQNLEAMPHAL